MKAIFCIYNIANANERMSCHSSKKEPNDNPKENGTKECVLES